MCLGIPARIVAIADAGAFLATVEVAGVRRQVDLQCVAPAEGPLDALLGRWALVHVGFAMSLIDEAEADATLALLRQIGEADAELAAFAETVQ